MKNWIPNKKIIKTVIGLAVLSFLVYTVALFVVLGQMRQVEQIYTDSESESSKEERSWAIRSLVEDNKENVDILRNFFIRRGDEVGFIKAIEEMGRRSAVNFEISSIDVRTKEIDTIKEDVFVKINVEGSWNSIMSFIDRLEKASFGLEVQNVTLDAKSAGVWGGFIELSIFREK